MSRTRFSRRRFVLAGAAAISATGLSIRSRTDGRPPVTTPRATDGDKRYEPLWDERLTVTVGPKQADLVGANDKVIQAAVDYVARLGGGTVHVLPGTFTLRNSIYLSSNVRLMGSGPDSIITRLPSQKVELADDSDWYDQEITLRKAADFQVGDGVVLRTTNPQNGNTDTIKRTLVARAGNRFKLNDGIRENLWLSGKPTCASLFPLLTSNNTTDVVIENITLDGNRSNTAHLDGNYAGCIFLQDCNRYTIRGVTTRNYNGDGISFQICHDVAVDNCHSHGNSDLGVHPGSGSQRPLLRGNRLEHNGIGIFWCWGVKFGLAEGNRIDGNRNYGISIGHNDTDNVIRDNDVLNSGKVGIMFRDDARGKDFWANRNLIANNRIVNNGGPNDVALDLNGKTKDITIRGNQVRETRGPMNRTGIRIDAAAERVSLENNTIEGFATEIDDRRTQASQPE